MNSDSEETVEHIATVTAFPETGSAEVVMSDPGQCDSCAAAKFCKPAGGGDRTVLTVSVDPSLDLSVGDRVVVMGTEAIHRRAIMLATVIPCIALVVTMAVVFVLTLSSGLSAIAGFAAMLLFFLLLYAFRGKLAREFRFKVVRKVFSLDESTEKQIKPY